VLTRLRTTIENVVVIAAVGVPVHYLTGLDWPWAIVIGAAAIIALRWLIHLGGLDQRRKPPLPGR
jgi:hypothetical protein